MIDSDFVRLLIKTVQDTFLKQNQDNSANYLIKLWKFILQIINKNWFI